jgi:hypothetical protein
MDIPTWRRVRQQPAEMQLGMPTFELSVPDALSSTSIGNTGVVACELTLNGTLRAEDWNDLYLLMDYDVGV